MTISESLDYLEDHGIRILIIALIGFMIILAAVIIKVAFGKQFTFNYTKQMQDEGRLLEFCIHNTTIKIPDLDKFCGMRYGKINSTYGEAIK